MLVLCVLLVAAPDVIYCQEKASEKSSVESFSPKGALELIVSTNRSERWDAIRELGDERNLEVTRLLAIVDGTNSDLVKVDAVIVLGQYRAQEAIPVLVRHLDLDDVYPHSTGGPLRRMRMEEYFESASVVSVALWRIGSAAIPALLDKITDEGETNTIAKCVQLCCKIEGREMTQLRLAALEKLATKHQERDRIEAALGILQNLDPFVIGSTGVVEILPRVADSTNMTDLLVTTCVSIQGREMTKLRLQELMQKTTDPEKTNRLQFALDILEKSGSQK